MHRVFYTRTTGGDGGQLLMLALHGGGPANTATSVQMLLDAGADPRAVREVNMHRGDPGSDLILARRDLLSSPARPPQ